MGDKLTRKELLEMMQENPGLQEKLNSMTDEDLAAVTAGISLYESSEGINRDSWFVTLLMKLMGRKTDRSSDSATSQEQATQNF